MLGHFPRFYPDELLHSVYARYHLHSGNGTLAKTARDLFGKNHMPNSIIIPSHLDLFCSNFSENTQISSQEIIHNHTLFPYFQYFLPLERVNKVIDGMRGTTSWEAILATGVAQSLVRPPEFLRFCSECAADDREMYSEAYWHRTHQLPGVNVCDKHGVRLSNSNVYMTPSKSNLKYRKWLYDLESFLKENSLVHVPADNLSISIQELTIAKISRFLLHNKSLCITDRDKVRSQYIFYLQRKNYLMPRGGIRLTKLRQDFELFFGRRFLSSLYCSEYEHPWIHSAFRKSGSICLHPLRHILLMIFLGMATEDYALSNRRLNNPYGESPWICLNPTAEHFLQPVVKVCDIQRKTDGTGIIGIFRCDCGFTYTRSGPDKSESDRMRYDTVREFGECFEKKLLKLRDDDNLKFNEISRILGITEKMASVYYKRAKNQEDLKPKMQRSKGLFAYYQEKNRNLWLQALVKYKGESRTSLAKKAGSGYVWLYKHDREWLKKNSPKKRSKKRKIVNWTKRDQIYAKKVVQTAKEIFESENYPVRLTTSSITKRLGTYFAFDKMPLTKKAIYSLIESVEEFQIRRIKWAARTLYSSGDRLSSNTVRKAAVLPDKRKLSSKVIQALEEHIDLYQSRQELA
ncbi:TnsD family transposase [Paenibacillus sp. ACRSA]|uniref:TnsD family Tn7-like transposition protein n=1 Tax=Paenibacillus sp. ACRSA TaxID=2918211 RepID=UPI001EF53315|nr:TnsD family Tn7-like transposition protein [Paenibacillus sp. ACRSA]MCG7377354.1 TnsD family transposase [Paenibacillus sp. ACRSA]